MPIGNRFLCFFAILATLKLTDIEVIVTDNIKLKRIYETPKKTDGYRILVDRLWPRGIKKESAELSYWYKEIAPSNELRKWFRHDVERFEEFRLKYKEELRNDAEKCLLVKEIILLATKETVTLLYAAKDPVCNNAYVLWEELKARKNSR